MNPAPHAVIDARRDREDELARLIKRAVLLGGRGWCSTAPLAIARHLLDLGVSLPATTEERPR